MRVTWWSALLAATAIGAGVGSAVAAAGHVDYKAEGKVVVQAKGGPPVVRPLLPNLRELATSSILAGNVDSTLRLPGSPEALRKRLHASIAPSSQVLVLSVTDAKQDRARQIAQEAAVVLTQLVQVRFRTPQLTATVLDPAHVVSHHGRHFLRDALIGAAIGLALATAVLLATRRGIIAARPPTDEKLTGRERQLKERIDLVSKRERAVAKRAGELAKRERDVESRKAQARVVPPPIPEPAAAREPEPVPQPVREPEPEPIVVPVRSRSGWRLDDLERLVRDNAATHPGSTEEWNAYLFHLRDHAAADGSLPSQFDSLVEDVFGELLRR